MSDQQPRLPYVKLSPEGIAPMQALEHYLNAFSGLERSLLEIVRLRVSLLNGCDFCIGLHRSQLEKAHEPATLIDAIADWHNSKAFTQRQVAALLWADAITNIQHGHASAAKYATLQQHFSEQEMVDLTLAISSINAWNRLAIAFRSQWRPAGRNADDAGGPTNESEAISPEREQANSASRTKGSL